MMHIFVGNLGYQWFRCWLVVCSAPSHYLKECWNNVNWIHGTKPQWNFNWNLNIFIEENAFEMSSGKCRPFCLSLNVLMEYCSGVNILQAPLIIHRLVDMRVWSSGQALLTYIYIISRYVFFIWLLIGTLMLHSAWVDIKLHNIM